MGTRCLVRVYDEGETEICCIYRQFDGYPDGMGKNLAKICGDLRLVRGMSDHGPDQANGMSCLAATLIARLKVRWEKTGYSPELDAHVPCPEPGNVYLYPPGTKDCWEEFEYHVRASHKGKESDNAEILLSCYDVDGQGMKKRELVPIAENVPAKDFMDACLKGQEANNLRVAAKYLHDHLKDNPWLLSVGVGSKELIVMAKEKPPKGLVPKEFEYFKVKVRVVGEIAPAAKTR